MSDAKTLCAEVVWKIENYSYCWHKLNEALYSPVVCIENLWRSEWCLGLYPNGFKDSNYISLYLYRLKDYSRMKYIEVGFEFAILDAECSIQKGMVHYASNAFKQESIFGWESFFRKNLLDEKKEVCLQGDVLTVRLRICNQDAELSKLSQFLLRTHIPVRESVFPWWIPSKSSDDSKITVTLPIEDEKNANVNLRQVNRKNKNYVEVVIDGNFLKKCSWKCDIQTSDAKVKFLLDKDEVDPKSLPYKKEFELPKSLDCNYLSNGSKRELKFTFIIISHDLQEYREIENLSVFYKKNETALKAEETIKTQNKIELDCKLKF